MTAPDYAVSPRALDVTAAGIEAVLDGLRSLGPLGTAEEGRGITRLAPLPGDVGHAGLNAAFALFCGRWEWGVRAAVRTGEDMAEGLRAAGVSYGQADDSGEQLLVRVMADVVGDPGAPDTAASVADLEGEQRPEWRMPGWDRLAAQWADTADDVVAGSSPGLVVRTLQDPAALDEALDDLRPIVG
jgi:hypothetical protein